MRLEQFGCFDFQGFGNLVNGGQGRVSFTPFNAADVGSMNPDYLGKTFLAVALTLSEFTNPKTELLAYLILLLHNTGYSTENT